METRPFETKNLDKWKSNLDSCIRCGYCYEHCPIFKHTRWESDAPRAKLIMLYGLLAGKLEPSAYIADKIASCFYCGRCVAACSSGVPLTEIFTDAKRDFQGTEFEACGTTTVTNTDCVACLACVRACPHEARLFVNGKIVTDTVKCQSCGICVDICPNKAISTSLSYGTNRPALNQEIGEFLEKETSKAIVFGCNWSYYPDFQASVMDKAVEPPYKILINMCGGRLEKPLLLEPLLQNAWGVLVACCPDGDCEHDGNVKAKAHVSALRELLEEMDIDPDRLQLVQIKHNDKTGFQTAIDTFMEKLETLGPLNNR
ncbi:putative fusion protein GlcF/heterodisulfide reductase HdrA [Desulforapulum autotrophicum HRM2]|uniref:Fusion protein GlcF/heterodisulfide reductase HdrA n=1 Tax=Desulforapulum autotrophicum (strain ATCC 43914 / DSM 3382 / VKM B-1955 / HRM2) TaxID=177437 RepID=C0QKR8_DESAH|nr:hydrogenase iron-sulfur subunit [Desulforapulum autotrophicum]ACN16158.1 putative fusion protein GlcF/heterodisulfide reductase HdrA [Desulforapulum autotrophicum HRM2]